MAYLWARALGGDSAVKLLQKLNCVDVAIDFACEQHAFGTMCLARLASARICAAPDQCAPQISPLSSAVQPRRNVSKMCT